MHTHITLHHCPLSCTPITHHTHTHPIKQILGVLGAHPDDFPVERLAFAHDGRLLASVAHDHAVRLWDMTCVRAPSPSHLAFVVVVVWWM